MLLLSQTETEVQAQLIRQCTFMYSLRLKNDASLMSIDSIRSLETKTGSNVLRLTRSNRSVLLLWDRTIFDYNNLRFTTTDVAGVPLGQLLPYNLEPMQELENGSIRGSFALLDAQEKEVIVEQFASQVGSLQRFRWQLATPKSAVGIALDLESRAMQQSMSLFSGGELVMSGQLKDLNGLTGDEWVIGKDSRQVILGFSSSMTLRLQGGDANEVLLESPNALPGGSLELFVSLVEYFER